MANEGMNTPPTASGECELCAADGGLLLWREPGWRLVRVDDPSFPGFYRLMSNSHVAEFSRLSPQARQRCMQLLAWVEGLVIGHLRPTKMNLASLGNMVPHLHWHVVARFDWDSHFPAPIWAQPQRPPPAERLEAVRALLPALDAALAAGAPDDPADR
jgi:diadenosine tetraphosphate (Ap4A) HIT family hydrolase